MIDLGLFANTDIKNGPGKVFNNLVKGLNLLNVSPVINEVRTLTGCLHGQTIEVYSKLPKNTLMGPNLMVVPDDCPYVWHSFKNHVTPSKWVVDKYRTFPITTNTSITPWPVGIDTDLYSDEGRSPKYNCLIYWKNRPKEHLDQVVSLLQSKGMTFKIISYGSYQEPELIQATKDCEFCFLLNHTESQGIAYMEILSAGVPCFCWDQTTWNGYPATSVPYFSKQCGVVSEELQEDTFDRFYFNLGYYKPRQYIVENHNLLGSSLKYLEILNSGS